LALAASAAVALTACGSSDDASTTAGTSASDAAAGPRTVQTAMGPVQITGAPERVVVLDTPELDLTTTLGITPVGTVKAAVGDGLPRYLADKAKGIANVGEIGEPNLVKIAQLKPDLILSSKIRDEQRYAQLTKIAPTVLTETPADWKPNVVTDAQALGKADEAKALLQQYEARAAALKAKLPDAADTTVSVVRFLPGEIRLYSPKSFIGTVLKDVGVQLPPAAEKATDINATLSLENLEQADADVLYTTTYGPEEDTDAAQAKRLPAWKDIAAVKDGRVYDEPDDVWMLGIAIRGAGLVLDELEKTLPAPAAR
jgi:iron complex transport system substrate-binding protein